MQVIARMLLQGWSVVTEQQRASDGGPHLHYVPSRRAAAHFDGASADAFPSLGLPAAGAPSGGPATTARAGANSSASSPAPRAAAPVKAPTADAVAPAPGATRGAAVHTLEVSPRQGPRRVGRSASPGGAWRAAAQPAGSAGPGFPGRPSSPQAPGLRMRRSSSASELDAAAAQVRALQALAEAHPWAPPWQSLWHDIHEPLWRPQDVLMWCQVALHT